MLYVSIIWLIEAMEAGCDVIASDRPFVHAICRPSMVFEPSSPQSIAKSVEKYDNNGGKETRLFVHDMLDELISRFVMK